VLDCAQPVFCNTRSSHEDEMQSVSCMLVHDSYAQIAHCLSPFSHACPPWPLDCRGSTGGKLTLIFVAFIDRVSLYLVLYSSICKYLLLCS
jgi:hypothetical protein